MHWLAFAAEAFTGGGQCAAQEIGSVCVFTNPGGPTGPGIRKGRRLPAGHSAASEVAAPFCDAPS